MRITHLRNHFNSSFNGFGRESGLDWTLITRHGSVAGRKDDERRLSPLCKLQRDNTGRQRFNLVLFEQAGMRRSRDHSKTRDSVSDRPRMARFGRWRCYYDDSSIEDGHQPVRVPARVIDNCIGGIRQGRSHTGRSGARPCSASGCRHNRRVDIKGRRRVGLVNSGKSNGCGWWSWVAW